MNRLMEGYKRFIADVWPAERQRYETLAKRGQNPETLVIACSDSRVDPQTIFNAGPGELFIVRNVAGLVPPYEPDSSYHGTSAALEFSVRVLGVRNIVVLGHALCGGVKAIAEGAPEVARDFVVPWMTIAKPALPEQQNDETSADYLCRCEASVIRASLGNLLTFPWIKEAVDKGALTLHGMRFDIRTGELTAIS